MAHGWKLRMGEMEHGSRRRASPRVASLARRAPIAVAFLVLACQTSYYDEYRAKHPGWEAALPLEAEPLEAVLASLYLPHHDETLDVTVRSLEIQRVDLDPWRELRFDRIRDGSETSTDAATYAVVAELVCTYDQGLRVFDARRVSTYLLPANRLEAYDHWEFRSGCEVRNKFRAAREEVAPVEREIAAQVAADFGRQKLELENVYGRGLAYVEAGRLAEAAAMLTLGERGYRALELATQRSESAAAAERFGQIERLRAKLLRALGLTPRPRPHARLDLPTG